MGMGAPRAVAAALCLPDVLSWVCLSLERASGALRHLRGSTAAAIRPLLNLSSSYGSDCLAAASPARIAAVTARVFALLFNGQSLCDVRLCVVDPHLQRSRSGTIYQAGARFWLASARLASDAMSHLVAARAQKHEDLDSTGVRKHR